MIENTEEVQDKARKAHDRLSEVLKLPHRDESIDACREARQLLQTAIEDNGRGGREALENAHDVLKANIDTGNEESTYYMKQAIEELELVIRDEGP